MLGRDAKTDHPDPVASLKLIPWWHVEIGEAMNLMGGGEFHLRPVSELELVTEFAMPNGTVTVVLDRSKGLLDIFAEHEADPLDWELTSGLIDRMGLSGELPRGEYLKGIVTWRIQLKEAQRAS